MCCGPLHVKLSCSNSYILIYHSLLTLYSQCNVINMLQVQNSLQHNMTLYFKISLLVIEI